MRENEITMGWHVKTWDRELGRGLIESSTAEDMPFDASVALVDDFVIGEAVEVDVERHGDALRIAKIWPDDPRFDAPGTSPSETPTLDPALVQQAETAIRSVAGATDYRVVGLGADLAVQCDDDGFSYGPNAEVVFERVEYVEIPTSWSGKSLRLANDPERSYLATRCELTDKSVAIRVVDDERRIYFVVCGTLSPGCTQRERP